MNLPQRLSGLNGALPTIYDPAWQSYTDLTQAQIAAFQAFPQDLANYAGIRRWQKESCTVVQGVAYLSQGYITVAGIAASPLPVPTGPADIAMITGLGMSAMRYPSATFDFVDNGLFVTLTAAQALTLFDAVSAYVQACRTAEATLLAGINATPPTITTRAQIDAALAVVSNAR